ncbi:MAG: DUF4390 domain-containing protein [Pseudomonadota bacterium]
MRVLLRKPLTGLCLLLLSNISLAQFSIQHAETRLVDEVYVLDANLHYKFTEVIIEALQNGVSLTLRLTIMVERERGYWWNERIATLKQGYELKYYALSRQYELKELNSDKQETNSDKQETFGQLNDVLSRLNKLKDFPLIDKHLIENDETYKVHLQTHLDIESLPVPLRPIAYLSSQWRLSSEWYLCPLQPLK